MLVLFKLIGRIPFWVLYPLGDLLSVLARNVYRPKVVHQNLKTAFPHKTEKEIKTISKKFYKNLLTVIVEVLKTISLSNKELGKRAKLTNPEDLNRAYQEGKSVFVFAAHYGNWEWIAHAITLHSPYNLDPIYKVQSNKYFDQFIYFIRSMYGGNPIPKENALRNILKNKEKTRALGIVGDQRPYKGGAKLWLNFMGQETAFFPGNVAMPYMTQFECYYLKIKRVKRGYYEVETVPIGKPPYTKGEPGVLFNYAKEIEKQLEITPEDWLWTHKRWKYKRSNEEELLSYQIIS